MCAVVNAQTCSRATMGRFGSVIMAGRPARSVTSACSASIATRSTPPATAAGYWSLASPTAPHTPGISQPSAATPPRSNEHCNRRVELPPQHRGLRGTPVVGSSSDDRPGTSDAEQPQLSRIRNHENRIALHVVANSRGRHRGGQRRRKSLHSVSVTLRPICLHGEQRAASTAPRDRS